MKFIRIITKHDATQMVVHLTRLSGLKQTKVREQFANTLGYRSYNGLLGALAKAPIAFYFQDFILPFEEFVFARTKKAASPSLTSPDWWIKNYGHSPVAFSDQVVGFHLLRLRIVGCDSESGPFTFAGETGSKLLIEEVIDSGLVNESSPLFRADEDLCIESTSQQHLWGGSESIPMPSSFIDKSYNFVLSSEPEIGIPDTCLTLGFLALYIPTNTIPTSPSAFELGQTYEVYSKGSESRPPVKYIVAANSIEYIPLPKSSSLDENSMVGIALAPCSAYRAGETGTPTLHAPFPHNIFEKVDHLELEAGELMPFQLTDNNGLYQADSEHISSCPLSFQRARGRKGVRFAYESFLSVRCLFGDGISQYRKVVNEAFGAVIRWGRSRGHDVSVTLMGDDRCVAALGGLGIYSMNKNAAPYKGAESGLHQFADALKSSGVTKVRANELIDPVSGQLLSMTLCAYDASSREKDRLHVESVHGYGLEYEVLKEAIQSTLLGGFEVSNVYEHEPPLEALPFSYDHNARYLLSPPAMNGDLDQLSFAFLGLTGTELDNVAGREIGAEIFSLSLFGRELELGVEIQTPVWRVPVGDLSGFIEVVLQTMGVSEIKQVIARKYEFIELLGKAIDGYFSILKSHGRDVPCQYGALSFFNRMDRDMIAFGLSVTGLSDGANNGRLISGLDIDAIQGLAGCSGVEGVRFFLSNNALK